VTTLIVDVSGVIHRCYHAAKGGDPNFLTRSDGLPVFAVRAFTDTMVSLLLEGLWDSRARQKLLPERVCFAFDAGGKTLRHDIFDEYKANRPEKPDDFRRQMPYFQQAIEALGCLPIFVRGFEADDIIATVARRAEALGDHVIIYSGDKDLFSLVSPSIEIYQPQHGVEGFQGYRPEKWIDRDAVIAKFGVGPSHMADFLALVGDTSDNVPGMPGCGAKGAADLLARYGSLEGVLAMRNELKPKLREWLNHDQNRNTLRMSRQLTTLMDDVPLGDLWEYIERPIVDPHELLRWLETMEFATLQSRVRKLYNL